MTIVERSIEELKPADYNPRKLTKDQRDSIERSLSAFGFVDPVIVNKHPDRLDVVVGGHQRVKVWGGMGNNTVPTVEVCLELERERELNVRLNRNTGDWDRELLEEFFTEEELLEWGFLSEEIDGMFEELDDVNENDPDRTPEEVAPIVREGEVWELGNHRLLCGSCLETHTVLEVFGEERAHCMWTDPPYNVDYTGGTGMKIKNDSMSPEEFVKFLVGAFATADAVLAEGSGFYVAHASREVRAFLDGLEKNGLTTRQTLVWVKSRFILGRQDHQWKHEPILYGWKDGAAHRWFGGRKLSTVIEKESLEDLSREDLLEILREIPSDVIEVETPHRNDIHPTMKPVALVEKMVRNSTKKGDLVFDPFLGSGSTLIACESSNRRCFGTELDPIYATAIVQRWQDYTGQSAHLKGTGETFDETRKARSG